MAVYGHIYRVEILRIPVQSEQQNIPLMPELFLVLYFLSIYSYLCRLFLYSYIVPS